MCRYCAGESEAGWIEMPNNGPIVACPVCNKNGDIERAWDFAERQRDLQNKSSVINTPIQEPNDD